VSVANAELWEALVRRVVITTVVAVVLGIGMVSGLVLFLSLLGIQPTLPANSATFPLSPWILLATQVPRQLHCRSGARLSGCGKEPCCCQSTNSSSSSNSNNRRRHHQHNNNNSRTSNNGGTFSMLWMVW
jgi:hypothetical protein